jgi:tetratricopeptide (TPR) repeat protein
LEKEPERRFASAEALAGDLGSFLAGDPISARPPSFRYRMVKKAKRHKALVATAVVSTCLLVTAGVVGAVLLAQKEGEKRRAVGEAKAETDLEKGRADEADRLREKNARVAKVMMAAQAKLFLIHRELKASYYDDTKDRSAKLAFFKEREKEINSFFDPFLASVERPSAGTQDHPSARDASDPGSATLSTALALKGWFVRLSGDEETALDLFRQAQETDPEVGWGWLFEVMYWLSRYLLNQTIPVSMFTSSGFELAPLPPETPEMTSTRLCFEKLVARLRASDLEASKGAQSAEKGSLPTRLRWGIELSPGIVEALVSPTLFGKEDPLAAKESVSTLLTLPEFFWMEEELYSARSDYLYMLEEFDEGLEDVRTFLERCPKDTVAHLRLGDLISARANARALKGEDPRAQLEEAASTYSKVIKRCPRMVVAYNRRANAYMSIGIAEAKRGLDPREMYEKSVLDYREALRRNPELTTIYMNLGNAYCNLGQAEAERGSDPRAWYRKALAEHGKALEREPGNASFLLNRGVVYHNLGEAEEALGLDPRGSFRKSIDDHGQACAKNPDNVSAHLNLGSAYFSLGKTEAARGLDPRESYRKSIEQCNEALKRNPDHVESYNGRGGAYCHLGMEEAKRGIDPRPSYRKAIAEFGEALKRNPEHLFSFVSLGIAHVNIGRAEASRGMDPRPSFRKGIEAYGQALKRNPQFSPVLNYRGRVYTDLATWEIARGIDPVESHRKAVADYRKALKINPNAWASYDFLGFNLLRLARYEEAITMYENAIRIVGDKMSHFQMRIALLKKKTSLPSWAREFEIAGMMLMTGGFAPALKWYKRGFEKAAEAGVLDESSSRPRAGKILAQAACGLAGAYAQLSVGKKGKLAQPAPVGAEEAASLRGRAVASLRKALEFGWTNLDEIHELHLFDPLRELPAFKALLAEFEK